MEDHLGRLVELMANCQRRSQKTNNSLDTLLLERLKHQWEEDFSLCLHTAAVGADPMGLS